jgi:hypothetical protein
MLKQEKSGNPGVVSSFSSFDLLAALVHNEISFEKTI